MISGLLTTPQNINGIDNATVNNVVRHPSNYQMLSRVNSMLAQFNEATTALQESSILAVNEASNERLENRTIAKYLDDFSSEINKLAQKINQQKGKFMINFQIFDDANKDILADIPTVKDNGATYTQTSYKNLDNPEFPKISPKGVFKHEYKLIGKALQDLDSVTDTNAKMAAIAAIYDTLVSSMATDWSEKCMETILQDHYNKECGDFVKCAYNAFVCGAKEITINQDEVLRSAYTLNHAKITAQQIEDSFDVLLNDLISITEELNAVVEGNKKNSISINTDADGVADATYVLSDKMMNKVNQILKAKTNQVSEVINLYLIVLAIKCDCFMKSLRQARDVIDIACFGKPSTSKSSEDKEHVVNTDNSEEEDIDDDDHEEDDEEEKSDDGVELPIDGGEDTEPTNEGFLSDRMSFSNSELEAICMLPYDKLNSQDMYYTKCKNRLLGSIKAGKDQQLISDIKNSDKYQRKYIKQYILKMPKMIRSDEKAYRKMLSANTAGEFALGAANGVNTTTRLYDYKNAGIKPTDLEKYANWIDTVAAKEFDKASVYEAVITNDIEKEFEAECYLFETTASRIMLIESELEMYTRVQQALLEEGEPAKQQPQQQNPTQQQAPAQNSSNQNNQQPVQHNTATTKSSEFQKKLDNAREKMNEMIANLINKLRSLVQKFVDVFINRNKSKIEFVKKNANTILQNGANGGGTIVEYDIEAIKKMQVNVEYSTNRQYLDSEQNFVTKVLKYDMKEGESFSETLTRSVIGDGKPVGATQKHVQLAINYITNEFQGIVKSVQDAQNKLTVKSKNVKIEAKRYAAATESATLESTLLTYFTEGDFDAPDNATNTKKAVSDNKSDVTKQLMLMYKINSVLLSTKMSLAQKAFNTYYSMCAFFASNYVGTPEEQKAAEQENKQKPKQGGGGNNETGNNAYVVGGAAAGNNNTSGLFSELAKNRAEQVKNDTKGKVKK